MNNRAREVLAAAYKADLARQLNATPMHPEGSGNFWADMDGWDVIDIGQLAEAGLRALEDAGLRVVPVEPTPEMMKARENVIWADSNRYDLKTDKFLKSPPELGKDIWRAMLEAAR